MSTHTDFSSLVGEAPVHSLGAPVSASLQWLPCSLLGGPPVLHSLGSPVLQLARSKLLQLHLPRPNATENTEQS